MQQNYGPFRLSGGQHIEDVPSLDPDGKPLAFKVKAITPDGIETHGGETLPTGMNGVSIVREGRQHSVYRRERKIMACELRVGDDFALAHEVTYGSESVPSNLRRKDVIYAPFKSNKPLDKLHNHPTARPHKFMTAVDVSRVDEVADLRRQLAEAKATQQDAQAPASGGKKLAAAR